MFSKLIHKLFFFIFLFSSPVYSQNFNSQTEIEQQVIEEEEEEVQQSIVGQEDEQQIIEEEISQIHEEIITESPIVENITLDSCGRNYINEILAVNNIIGGEGED
jgi:hypothetical protein